MPNELWLLVDDRLPTPDRNRLAQATRHLRDLLYLRLVKDDIKNHGSVLLHWAVEKVRSCGDWRKIASISLYHLSCMAVLDPLTMT